MNILPGAFSVFGGLAQGAFNTMSNYSSNNTNKEAIEMSNRFNREMWELEKEYNSPLAQMKRLQEAGINPAFAYSNGVSNTVSSAPTATPPIANQPYLGNELAEIGNRLSLDTLRDIQGDESESRIRLNDSTIIVQSTLNTKHQQEIRNLEKQFELISSQVLTNEATIRNLNAISEFYDEQKRGLAIDNWIKEASKESEVAKRYYEAEGAREAVNYTIARIAEAKANKKFIDAQTSYTKEQERKCIKEIEEVASRIKHLDAETASIEFWNGINNETRQYILDSIDYDVKQQEMEYSITELQEGVLAEKQRLRDADVVYRTLDNLFQLVGGIFGTSVNISSSGSKAASVVKGVVTKKP